MRRGYERIGEAGACERPYVVKTISGREMRIRCKRRRGCGPCSELWAGDSRVRLLSNFIDGHRGRVVLVTVTAPGQDVLPLQDGVVLEEAAYAWNSSAPAQWSQMHRRAMTQLRRGNGAPKLLGYVWAYQRRGVLHLHLALAWETELDRIRARRYVQLLKGGLAHEWCFGFVDLRMPRYRGPKGLASYLAKYVCKEGASGRPELAETVDHDDVPARPIYISRELTATTRCTMRNLRLRRYYWRARSTRRVGVCDCWYVEDMWERGIRVRAGKLIRTAHDP